MKVQKILASAVLIASPLSIALGMIAAPKLALILAGLEFLVGGFDLAAGITLVLAGVLALLVRAGVLGSSVGDLVPLITD